MKSSECKGSLSQLAEEQNQNSVSTIENCDFIMKAIANNTSTVAEPS